MCHRSHAAAIDHRVGVRRPAAIEQQVHVEAIAPIGGHPARGGVRLPDESARLELDEDIPDSRRRHAERPAPGNDHRRNRFTGLDILANDGREYPAGPQTEILIFH